MSRLSEVRALLVEVVVRGSVLLNFGLLVGLHLRRHCGIGPRVSMVRCEGVGFPCQDRVESQDDGAVSRGVRGTCW